MASRTLLFYSVLCVALATFFLCPAPEAFCVESLPLGGDSASEPGQAAGGLIGYLFLGQPFVAITFFDVIIFFAVFFFIARLVLRRAGERSADPREVNMDADDPDAPAFGPPKDSEARKRAQAMWSHLSSEPEQHSTPEAGDSPQNLSSGVKQQQDDNEFLEGAKMVYRRIREALEQNTLEDVQDFVTSELFQTMLAMSDATRTAIPASGLMRVDAMMLEMSTHEGVTSASVQYTVLLSHGGGGAAQEIKEVWRFHKNAADPDATWLLDSMERLQ